MLGFRRPLFHTFRISGLTRSLLLIYFQFDDWGNGAGVWWKILTSENLQELFFFGKKSP